MIETRFIESLQQTTLDVSTLPAGSYILEITINGQKVIRKIQVK
ncbi:MAG: T9SS type A sorting domain-containing protein [Clostridiales bacterium]|nr:T9SS type A sorting domain-containing protein [Clostridiales bacterium]